VLPGVIRKAVDEMPWPKTMRWGEGTFRWVRPIHQIMAIFDGKPLQGMVDPEPHTRFVFTGMTHGHRFLAPDAVPIRSFAEYRTRLRDGFVMLDREERKRVIVEQATALADMRQLRLRDDPTLVDEVAGLVEWPVALIGRIDEVFMDVPPEVLTSAMRTHQRYFALLRPDGSLAPRFIVVANTQARYDGQKVVAGNERVLRARLADAKFFWDTDRKTRLADRVPALRSIVFHARLGSIEDKLVRLQSLAADLTAHVPGADVAKVRSAALLCKADLTTGMVGEFPELQGVMGRYYALEEGEDAEVADAVADHYAPQGPGDRCPTAPVSVTVALADKLDTLVGFFGIGEKPTGSRDPYALRRAGLGLIRLIRENGLRIPLGATFRRAAALYDGVDVPFSDAVFEDLLDFLGDRLKVHLRDEGVRHDLISAVFARRQAEIAAQGEKADLDLVRLLARVGALEAFLETEDGGNLLTAYRRAANIVRIESRKDGRAYDEAPDPALLHQDEERALGDALAAARQSCADRLSAEDFAGAMTALAGLRKPVDGFFDHVTVNAEDAALRANRLALLSAIVSTMNQVADFSRIEG
jgi:glycyl-tRNA synthetase beta chain